MSPPVQVMSFGHGPKPHRSLVVGKTVKYTDRWVSVPVRLYTKRKALEVK